MQRPCVKTACLKCPSWVLVWVAASSVLDWLSKPVTGFEWTFNSLRLPG